MPDDQFKRLGAALKRARENRCFTQAQLSEAADVSIRYIGRIERGEVNPSYEILVRLERVLGVSFDFRQEENTETTEVMLREIIDLYKSCPSQGKRLISKTVRAIANEFLDAELLERGD